MHEVRLTPRQRQIVILIGMGNTNKEIARTLGISPYTVKEYVHNIADRFHIKHRAAIALLKDEVA
jgi:LuxR family transcriptional regulator, maltose regulon positive regulatory protein